MTSLKFWLIFTLAFAILVPLVISLVFLPKGNQTIVSYSKKGERPVVKIDKTEFDLGKIDVSGTQEVDFLLTNSGVKPLQLFQISTSCGCTTAKIVRENGQESPEFNMHKKEDSTVLEVIPKETIKIKVIYRPFVMPVKGPVSRQVYLNTNDPLLPKLTLVIKAQII